MQLAKPYGIVSPLVHQSVLLQTEEIFRGVVQFAVVLGAILRVAFQVHGPVQGLLAQLFHLRDALKGADFVRQHRVLLRHRQKIALVGIAIDAGQDAVFGYAVADQVSIQLQMKVIVVEKILRNARHGRSQCVSHGEQQNAHHRRLVQPTDPAEQDFDTAFPVKKKQVNNQNDPGKSERSHNRGVERDGESAQSMPPVPCKKPHISQSTRDMGHPRYSARGIFVLRVDYFNADSRFWPLGVPQPEQASQPGPAANLPSSRPSVSLLPVVMSFNTLLGPTVEYNNALKFPTRAPSCWLHRAMSAAHSGEAALVPPTMPNWPPE